MPDRHRRPTVTGRPDQDVKERIEAELKERGWTVDAYIVAAILWGLEDVDEAIRTFERHKPPDAPRGRPRKSDQP